MDNGWVGFDLDGTLAYYDEWRGPAHVGPPVKPVLDKLKETLATGRKVKIFTARVCSMQSPEDIELARKAIEDFCLEYIGQVLEVTAEKDWFMLEFYDDRAISVEYNTGKIKSYE